MTEPDKCFNCGYPVDDDIPCRYCDPDLTDEERKAAIADTFAKVETDDVSSPEQELLASIARKILTSDGYIDVTGNTLIVDLSGWDMVDLTLEEAELVRRLSDKETTA